MTHLIADEKLGGVQREYIEVARKAKVGDYVVITQHSFNADYIGNVYKVVDITEKGTIDGAGVIAVTTHDSFYADEYCTLEPTDIVVIDGIRYRLVERKAEVGEKVLVVKADVNMGAYKNGEVLEAAESQQEVGGGAVYVNSNFLDGSRVFLNLSEYHVLVPVKPTLGELLAKMPTESEREYSPDIYDLLSNLATRVTSLERITGELVRAKSSVESQLRDTQRNIERIAQDHENVAFKVVDIEQAIGGILDSIESNTSKPKKSAEDILREISKLLEGGERA